MTIKELDVESESIGSEEMAKSLQDEYEYGPGSFTDDEISLLNAIAEKLWRNSDS